MEIKPYVLFADDSADTLEFLQTAAVARGWRVDTAQTAEEMLEKINAHCDEAGVCYDLVVSDINYRGTGKGAALDGISALRLVRKKFPDLPFILLSAWLEPLTISEAKRFGAATQEKPIDPAEFLDRAAYIIGLTSARYNGEDRRRKSINTTGHNRRASDKGALSVPTVLRQAIEQAQAAQRKAG